MTDLAVGGRLPERIRVLIERAAAGLPQPDSLLLDRQVAAASVIARSPTMVDVVIPAGVEPIGVPDGPLPDRLFVTDGGEEAIGEILVWVRHGLLLGVEQAWYVDEPPSDWPRPDRVSRG